MSGEQFEEILLLVIALWFLAKGTLFGMIWHISRVETPGEKRTRFGEALRGVLGGLIWVSMLLGVIFAVRFSAGPDWDGWSASILRLLLMASLFGVTIHDIRLLSALRELRRLDHEYVVSIEGVFGALAAEMPIVVADQTGTIQHVTDALNTLVGANDGELVGQNLTTLMPERYRPMHLAGMQRYLTTGVSRIIGTVVPVDLLLRNGDETPVYLVLTTADVEGDPWFIGAMWSRQEVVV